MAMEQKEAAIRVLHDEMSTIKEKNRELFKRLQTLKGNIRVMARIRPAPADTPQEDLVNFGAREKGECADCWGKLHVPVERKTATGRIETTMRSFDFERIFGPEETNKDVFDEVSELIECVLEGDKVGIFAYGQTGSGKTHTLCHRGRDSSSDDGVIPKTLSLLFQASKAANRQKITISMSVVEIYLDKTYDLLQSSDRGERVQTRLETAFFVPLESEAEANNIIDLAMERRVTRATNKNDNSSRSHLIINLQIDREGPQGQLDSGYLYLVDLAGSERPAAAGAQSMQLKEGIRINQSLTSLNLAISALGKGTSVSYDSDLTRALRPVLSQGSKSLMFVMVSPLKKDLPVSIQTLEKGQEAANARLAAANRTAGRPSSSGRSTPLVPSTSRPSRNSTSSRTSRFGR
ncbi:P-loop containing nucleoside triphosphate hydrolase protein [Hypoxylon sp. FL1857]|nr:P-loop containing nucleoside triphosphate hydrolase protein [Hypoxylon sp. FL1857]